MTAAVTGSWYIAYSQMLCATGPWTMDIVEKYPIQIDHWIHKPIQAFMGLLSDNGYSYILGITPEDPTDEEIIYFNVWVEKTIKNETTNETVFFAKTYSAFKVRNKSIKPTTSFFFDLIDKATFDFAQIFHQQTRETNLSHHRIAKPNIEHFKDDIDKAIDIWDKEIRNSSVKEKPNWQTNFRGLPTIPESKKWRKDSHSTLEQDIAFKLMDGKPISENEEKLFVELASFYQLLDEKLRELDYKTFTPEDFENFKNYIFYAFNYVALLTNDLTIVQTYRLVVNEYVTGKNEQITDINFLKYPKLDIVKDLKKFNRSNTPNSTVFYCAENIDTALKEIKPPLNKLVTVGVWKPKNPEKSLISFPILHSDDALNVSEGVQKATKAFEEYGNFNSSLFKNFMRYYFKLFGREFTKRVNHHYEYYISALFSEQVFQRKRDIDKAFQYDCIIYPSVGNDFMTENLAIHPDTLDNDFKLTEVFEFEVEEAYYDKKYTLKHPNTISLAKVKNVRGTNKIRDNGNIEW